MAALVPPLPPFPVCVPSAGKDKYAETLKEAAEEAKVNVAYMQDDAAPTGALMFLLRTRQRLIMSGCWCLRASKCELPSSHQAMPSTTHPMPHNAPDSPSPFFCWFMQLQAHAPCL